MHSPILGRHLLLELYDCANDFLNDPAKIENGLQQVILAIGATAVQSVFHRFEPIGVSGVIVLAESHLTIHTWPEYRYAALDLFTCDSRIDYNQAEAAFKALFKAGRSEKTELKRGQMSHIQKQVI
ncbi:MAG: adenosylmethionine decarboxylase [Calditrichaeota bacterium]|nr:MAG: adenosylmethionine decarboxylase [Calditrichota bacterium]